MPTPLRFHADPVARHAWLVMNNGNALADDPIEQSRFAHVRTPNNSD
jgi:hypothetical protein